jgi:hypothetical protein
MRPPLREKDWIEIAIVLWAMAPFAILTRMIAHWLRLPNSVSYPIMFGLSGWGMTELARRIARRRASYRNETPN